MDEHSERKKLKPTPTHDTIVNYERNSKYLDMRKQKFWHLAKEKRRLFTSLSTEDAITKSFNSDYVRVNSYPPLSALRIRNHSGYSHTPQWEEFTQAQKTLQDSDSFPVEESDEVAYATQETLESVKKCDNPHTLMYITQEEQDLFKFTIEDKIGVPMYEKLHSIDSSGPDDQSDELKSRVFNSGYTPRRIVAPPEYPFAYYRLKRDQECIFCGKIGKDCHNVRYGMYLSAVVTRYYRENMSQYNEFDAVKRFHDTYKYIAEFEEYLVDNRIEAEFEKITIPECVAFDSLVFALNSVEWDIMWGKNQEVVKKPPAKEPSSDEVGSSNDGADSSGLDEVEGLNEAENIVDLTEVAQRENESESQVES